jgi:hypothetical protein
MFFRSLAYTTAPGLNWSGVHVLHRVVCVRLLATLRPLYLDTVTVCANWVSKVICLLELELEQLERI